MARPSGGLPADLLPKLQTFPYKLFAEEAFIGSLAVLSPKGLKVDGGGVADQMSKDRMGTGNVPLDPAFESKEMHPEESLAQLDSVLDDSVALVLVRRRALFQHRAPMAGSDATAESHEGRLAIGLQRQGHALVVRNAERAKAFKSKLRGGILMRALLGNSPTAGGPGLPMFGH